MKIVFQWDVSPFSQSIRAERHRVDIRGFSAYRPRPRVGSPDAYPSTHSGFRVLLPNPLVDVDRLKSLRNKKLKASGGTRTHDFRFTKAVLYRLSYAGNEFSSPLPRKREGKGYR